MAKTTAFSTVPTLPIRIENGLLYSYDSGRDLFLTPQRTTLIAGKHGRTKNMYLRLMSDYASNITGYRMTRDSVITTVSAQNKGNTNWNLHIRKNGSDIDLYSLVVTNGGAHSNSVNLSLDTADTVQFYCESNAFFGVQYPIVWIEVASKL